MVLFENISLKPKTGKIKVKAMLIAYSLFLYGCHSGEKQQNHTDKIGNISVFRLAVLEEGGHLLCFYHLKQNLSK